MIANAELLAETKRVIRAIQNVFQISGDLAEEDVDTLHNRLESCIHAINSRLRRCDNLMTKGLRQEALQEVEIEPNLLQLVNEADFSECQAWSDYVRQFGIPPIEPLLFGVAAQLDAAYAESQPLHELLAAHRTLALARAPLRDRIKVLRTIARKDEGNAVWKSDLAEYESARFRDLESELREGLARKDLRFVGELKVEMADSPWQVRPPVELVEKTSSAYESLRAESALKRLDITARELIDAFENRNLAKARQAAREWDKHIGVPGLTGHEALIDAIAPALDWLKQQAEQEQLRQIQHDAIVQLGHALNDPAAKRDELCRRYAEVESVPQPVPETVTKRFVDRIAALDARARRRRRWVVGSAVSTMALVVAIAVTVVFATARVTQRNTAVARLGELVADQRAEEAGAYYDELPSWVCRSPEVEALKGQIDELFQVEKQRSRDVASVLTKVSQQLNTLTGKRSADPLNAISLVEDTEALLMGIRESVRTDGEQHSYGELDLRLASVKEEVQTEIDERWKSDYAELAAGVQRVLSADCDDVALSQLRTDLISLKSRPKVRGNVIGGSGIDEWIRRVDARIKDYTAMRQRGIRLARIEAAIGVHASMRQALQEYVTQFKSGRRVDDFKKIMEEELAFVETVAEFDRQAEAWNDLTFESVEEDADAALELIQTFAEDFRGFPDFELPETHAPFLKSVVERVAEDDLNRLRSYFSRREFDMLCVIEEGHRVYCTRVYDGDTATHRSLQGFLDSTDPSKTVRGLFHHSRIFDSPQKTVAAEIRKLLDLHCRSDAVEGPTYEEVVCDVIGALLNSYTMDDKTRRLDPILVTRMLRDIANMTCRKGSHLEEELSEFWQRIDAVASVISETGDPDDLDAENWFLYDAELVARANAAQTILDEEAHRFESTYVDRVIRRGRELRDRRRRLPRMEWLGVLIRDTEGNWRSPTRRQMTSRSGGLFVVSSYDDEPCFERIGTLDQGRIKLDPPAPDQDSAPATAAKRVFVEGRPVYLVIEPVENGS